MAFESEFLDLFPHTVTVKSRASVTGYGGPTFSTPNTSRARVTYKTRVIRSKSGEEKVSVATIWLPPPGYVVNGRSTPAITFSDEITTPDGQHFTDILSIDLATDETGDHHQKLMV